MTSELTGIQTALTDYLDGLYEADLERLARVFLPEAHLYASIDGQLASLSLPDWFDKMRSRQSAKAAGHPSTNQILSIDVNGNTALGKVTCSYPPSKFTDYINLLKIGNEWKIIAKIYHVSPLPS